MHNNVTTARTPSGKVNIPEELSTISKYWSQKIIGEANGQLIKLAKGTGEINWHHHDDQDELFIVYKGHLTIQLRDRNVELYPHEMFIVPKGVEHCPNAHGDVEFLIMGLNITSNAAGGRPEKWNEEI
ncbi:cupin domain-containing protein [Panacibacter ginsenosidivorans]|uniref:Cupin domain-containing protein n=2 Tax=Panacibacter ginsenosidivorans TaxID=1813871 RepID=A0A5B8VGK6_9BACT|nr:cupin domain-containing protein [Panacibacter ginsenosidivorans]